MPQGKLIQCNLTPTVKRDISGYGGSVCVFNGLLMLQCSWKLGTNSAETDCQRLPHHSVGAGPGVRRRTGGLGGWVRLEVPPAPQGPVNDLVVGLGAQAVFCFTPTMRSSSALTYNLHSSEERANIKSLFRTDGRAEASPKGGSTQIRHNCPHRGPGENIQSHDISVQ